MKRCPECKRDYYDETLLYCLDDGSPLLDGPASDERGTAILSEPEAVATGFRRSELPGEAPTKPQIDMPRQRIDKRLLAVSMLAIIALGGFLGYRYFTSSSSRQIDSIAVMPFVNEGGNAEIDYLSDGITETLISSLSRLPDLTVKPRSSVFRYKGKNQDHQTLGRELNVQSVLTGIVTQHGNDLNLHIELVDAATDRVLWSEDYKRPIDSLVALQSDIAREVSTKLKNKLSPADEKQLTRNYANNSEAQQLYLKGRFHLNKRTKNDVYKAIEYFRQSVQADPNYALPYTGLADVHILLPGFDSTVTRRESSAQAREYALMALSLDETLSQAHVSIGQVLQSIDLDYAGAEREFTRAIELDPNNAAGHANLGYLLTARGRTDEAEANHRRALELEPVNAVLNSGYGRFLMFARRYDESVTQLRKSIDLEPNFVLSHLTLANTYTIQGRYAEAADEYVKGRESSGVDPAVITAMRESFAKGGWKGLIDFMDSGKFSEEMRPKYIRAAQHVSIGQKERALAELEQAFEERDGFISLLNIDPRLDPLRNEPRFKELVKKLGL